MTELTVSRGSGIDAEKASRLQALISGQVLLPLDAEYEESRKVWNGMVDKRPAVIIKPVDVSDVRHAIAFARAEGMPVSIKGGGHNVAGHAVSEGGVMLDLACMRSVIVNPSRRTAWVQGGALWSDVDRATAEHGLATTGGVISSTGVAGLTLGGGIGWLVGKHGMTIDNLLEVDLVTADCEFLTVNETNHPDLFWALRGGGGNFGVATGFTFKLHPQGDVLAGFIAYPVEKAAEVLAFYREFAESAPDQLTIYALLTTDAESGARLAVMGFCWPGDLSEGEAVIAPLRQFGSPLMEMIGQMPYTEWQAAFDSEYPHGRRYYWKGLLTRELSDEALDAIVAHGTRPPLPLPKVVIEFYGGPMNRVTPWATAFPHRDARYQTVIIGGWDDPADDQTGIDWVRTTSNAIAPHALNASFLNFNSTEEAEAKQEADQASRVRAGYAGNMERLVEIKRRYDPTNLFRENNNIRP